MSVIGITSATRTALATAITAGGLECRTFDTWDIDAGNIATLGLVRWRLVEQPDQSYGFRHLVIPVLVYQVIDGAINDSLAYQETNVEKVIDGLARDRDLGGKVVSSDVDGGDVAQSYYREPNGQAFSIASLDVVVTPFPSAAS